MNGKTQPVDPGENGQIVVLSAMVLAVLAVVLVGVVLVGAAMVERTAATVAADAVALADVQDHDAGRVLVEIYREGGVEVSVDQGLARAEAAGAHAQSRAELVESGVAPLIHAIVARAGQLVGAELEIVGGMDMEVVLSPADAERFSTVALEFGMCSIDMTTFGRC
ncbi:MAG: hypothetical protein AAF567_11075 [Actinomycetota bacterium]